MTYSLTFMLQRGLFWSHRWLGVLTCLVCAMWFLSGLVLVYVPFPAWRDEERVATLRPLDATAVNIPPEEALARAGLVRVPTVFRLEMWGNEPVYRVVDFGRPFSVSAVDGRTISHVTADEGEQRLRQTFPALPVRFIGEVIEDQWTVSRLFAPHRPLLLFALEDGRGTRIYVSSRTGEIVLDTTAVERFWNWLGAVPHWIYFAGLRANAWLWRQTVMWISGSAAVGAVLGIWIGMLRLRLRGRFSSGRVTPYRGYLLWHHLTGLIGGVFVVTWLGSGWLSVSPFGWFNNMAIGPDDLARYYGAGPPSFETTLPVLRDHIDSATKALSFSWVAGAPIVISEDGDAKRAFDGRSGTLADLTEDRLSKAAASVLPSARIVMRQRLDAPDLYWYSHVAQRPVPALRVGFDDASATWVMIDLVTGRIVGVSTRVDRIYRWLFSFVHQYDLPWLLNRPVLRLLLIWVLSLLGILISLTGVVLASNVLKRKAAR